MLSTSPSPSKSPSLQDAPDEVGKLSDNLRKSAKSTSPSRSQSPASRLSRQFRDRSVEKTYLAIVEGCPDQKDATLEHWLRKDERHRRMHVTMKDVETAQVARLRYTVQRQLANDCSLVQVSLETGRKHQIRVQLSAAGHPIVGDRKYKSSCLTFRPGIALHSHRVTFEHPTKREPVTIEVPTPDCWSKWLGGSGAQK